MLLILEPCSVCMYVCIHMFIIIIGVVIQEDTDEVLVTQDKYKVR